MLITKQKARGLIGETLAEVENSMNKIYPSKFKDWKKQDRELAFHVLVFRILMVAGLAILITFFI